MQRIHKVLQGLSLSAGAKVCLVLRSSGGYFEMMRPSLSCYAKQ